jgi:hypothetical protein
MESRQGWSNREDELMVNEHLVIKSNGTRCKLQLAIDADEFIVTITDHGLTAEARGWWNSEMEEPQQLARFFEDLASDWRGWDGQKSWRALERPFFLSATHDGLGHVTLTVRLEEGWVDPNWSAEAHLAIDAGGLTELATRVARFVSRF